MSYTVSRAARKDIDAIADWIISNFGVLSAMEAETELIETFDLLDRHPHMGIERPDLTSRPVRFFSLWPNWIVYAPEQPLVIHRVIPARMDLRKLRL